MFVDWIDGFININRKVKPAKPDMLKVKINYQWQMKSSGLFKLPREVYMCVPK